MSVNAIKFACKAVLHRARGCLTIFIIAKITVGLAPARLIINHLFVATDLLHVSAG
jgi:hypothetical protein